MRHFAAVVGLLLGGFLPFALLLFSLWFLIATFQALALLLAWALPMALPWLLLWALVRHRRNLKRRPHPRRLVAANNRRRSPRLGSRP